LNPMDIDRTIQFLKAHQINVVFPESNVNRDVLVKIASASRELGLPVRICTEPLYGDSTSGLSYLEMMRKNGQTIAQQLEASCLTP
jgi:manganese/zinc/iron transport system substrate-binding protein